MFASVQNVISSRGAPAPTTSRSRTSSTARTRS